MVANVVASWSPRVIRGVGATWLGVVGMLDVVVALVGLSGVVVLLALPRERVDAGAR